ncbi:hypothetical protein N7456_006735 [Penicillium angulare]|uniref:Uncharacterized protein n=1 Tax=Penicillium angulare TaxID=116970 RepID=A0A9W9FIF9_9EURO|nr:hypothetical protein N7456_006735 [Penicillium angulare]
MPSPQNVRRMVLAGAVTCITIAGTLYGAGIKTKEEIAQETKKRQEATFDEQMTALQNMRSNLTARRGMIETQIRDLDTRVQEKKERNPTNSDGPAPIASNAARASATYNFALGPYADTLQVILLDD